MKHILPIALIVLLGTHTAHTMKNEEVTAATISKKKAPKGCIEDVLEKSSSEEDNEGMKLYIEVIKRQSDERLKITQPPHSRP
jgi:hypothetical protein